MQHADTERSWDRALVAALVGLVIAVVRPLLPVYGDGHQFVFALGYPLRFDVSLLVSAWSIAVAILLGVLLLSRRPTGAAGAFMAVAVVVARGVVSPLIDTPNPFAGWQKVLVLGWQPSRPRAWDSRPLP